MPQREKRTDTVRSGSKRTASPFVKSMATLVSGSAIAQIITIVVSPLTTRLFGAEELGVYTLVISSVSMFGAVLSLRYDMAIVYEDDDNNIFPLVVLSTVIAGLLSLVVAVAYYFYFMYFSGSGYSPLLASVFTFIQCFLFGLINVLNSYNNRCKEYGTMSAANVERTLAQNIGIVVAGILGLGSTGLVATQSVGYLFGLRRQAISLRDEISELKSVKRADLHRVARKHKAQAIWSAPAAFANGFSYSIINYLLELMFSATTVGYYSISVRMLGLPTNVIAANISRVFVERAAEDRRRDGDFRNIFLKTLGAMLLCAVPLAVLLMVFAPPLFEIVFGAGWDVAGEYVRILTPMYVLRFITASLNSSAMVAGKQQYDFVIQLLMVVCVLGAFGTASALSLGVEDLLQLINLLLCAVYVAYILLFWKCAKSRS